jgi:hypothetical protein
MSTRLQVLLDDADYKAIRKQAKLQKMTLAEWVRTAIRKHRQSEPESSAARKLATLRQGLATNGGPPGDIDEILRDIKIGRGHFGMDEL